MKFAVLKFRVFNKDFHRIMKCKLILDEADLENMINFLESSKDRIIVLDEVQTFEGRDMLCDMLRRIRKELEDDLYYLP